jgi:sulfotransferase
MNFVALSSLPRSGSTLLIYILNQNPKFTIGPDSEISYILNNNRSHIKDRIRGYQIPHQKATECFLNFCRSGTQSWIDTLVEDKNIFIDKSRGWTVDMDFTFKVFPELKMIINIRDLRSVVSSFEKVHCESIYADRKSYYKDIDTDLQRQRLDGILNFPMLKDGLTALRELIEIPKKYNSNILITRHEDLIEDPNFFMETLYDFLELPYFQHDFENIEQDSNYHDNVYMPYGNHKIRNSLVKTVPQKFDYIRSDLLEQMTKGYSWYFNNFYSDRIKKK